MKIVFILLSLLSTAAHATDVPKGRNRTSNGDTCQYVSVGGVMTDVLCIDGATGVVQIPEDLEVTGYTYAPGGMYSGSFSLSDDDVITLTPPGAGRGMLMLWGSTSSATTTGRFAIVAFRVNTYVATVAADTDVTVAALNTDFTAGTGDGVDTDLNISVQASTIEIKNRRGGTAGYAYAWISF